MFSILTLVIINVVVILVLATIVGTIAGEGDAVESFGAGFVTAWVLGSISLTGWFLYVVAHFVAKFW